jgi:hypothetical protein
MGAANKYAANKMAKQLFNHLLENNDRRCCTANTNRKAKKNDKT